MGKKGKHPPESNEALDAVEAVIRTAKRKKNFFEANVIPLKGDSKRERRRKSVFDLMLLVVVASAVVLVWYSVLDPMNAKKDYEALMRMRQTEATTLAPEEQPTTPLGEVVPMEPVTEKPTVVHQSAEKFLARNKDYKFWLSAPGGNINYPVVQYTDNDYYLHKNFDRKPSRYGNPFLDYRSKTDPVSTNLIIYGHNMKDGTIFAGLKNYRQRDVVARYPIITLEWPGGNTSQYKIFSVLVVNGKAKDDNGHIFAVNTPDFPDAKSFEGYIRQLEERTYTKTGVDVQYGDKLIALQTCVYDFEDEFLYVVGRMVRPGESIKVDPAGVKANPNPRLPQIMYTKRGAKNPFVGAEQWSPPSR